MALVLVLAAGGLIAAGALVEASRDTADPPLRKARSSSPSCRSTNYGEGEALARRNREDRDVLVPPGSEEVLLCRYWGYGVTRQTRETQARAGKLALERRLLRRSLLQALTREYNRVRPARGTYSCPFDDGSNVYAVFGHGERPDVVVETDLTGCGFTVGDSGGGGFTPPRLRQRLERLTIPVR